MKMALKTVYNGGLRQVDKDLQNASKYKKYKEGDTPDPTPAASLVISALKLTLGFSRNLNNICFTNYSIFNKGQRFVYDQNDFYAIS
jgi:hypothetical protein